MLFAAFRVSYQTASRRPLGATENVPNQCHLLGLTGSSLILRGELKVTPPSVPSLRGELARFSREFPHNRFRVAPTGEEAASAAVAASE